ncbi:MAG: IS701 family transposase [Rhodoferax sp.]
MTDDEILDIYSDYLISSFGQTTATGLSALLGGQISHDRIRRFLAGPERTAADLWQRVKLYVRDIARDDGVLILDDSIAMKPYTDENDIICWHYDHATEGMVKGINFLTALYHCQGVSLPVGVTLIAKTEHYIDKKDGKEKRRSPIEKNAFFRAMIEQAVINQIVFRYILNDVWYASAENMRFIKQTVRKEFVMPLKSNRKIALTLTDKHQGRYVKLNTLTLNPDTVREIYLEGVEFPLLLIKQIFVNEDGSSGVVYLVTSDSSLTYGDITALYRKRWNVEPYHKSLKQNASLEQSPTHTVTTQTNHFFAALDGYIKRERLKGTTKLNHFALKAKLYAQALRSAFDTLQTLQATP